MTDVTRWNDAGCRSVGATRWRLELLPPPVWSAPWTHRLWFCDVFEGPRIVEHFVGYSPKRCRTQEQARVWADGRIIATLRRQERDIQRRIRLVAGR